LIFEGRYQYKWSFFLDLKPYDLVNKYASFR